MLLELHQREAGAPGMAALVASIDARPLPGLLATLAGQDAEADRYSMLHGELMQACRRFTCDNVVMGGFAPDHAAERDAAAMPPCPADKAIGEREAERKRNLERAGHGEPHECHLVGLELLDGARRELVGDVLVEARLDDQNRTWTFAGHDHYSKPQWPVTLSP